VRPPVLVGGVGGLVGIALLLQAPARLKQPLATVAGSPATTRYATSSTHARSIPRDDRFPRAYAYINNATIIDGSYAGRPCPSAR
jgi:hypothetical protein